MKKCKGTHKHTAGLGCGKPSEKRKYGLGVNCCYKEWLYKTPQGLDLIRRTTLQVSKPRIVIEKAIVEKKERDKLSNLLKNTRNKCHEYIRLRDRGKPCAACGTHWHSAFEAGHYFKAESYSTLKFDEDNIHGCCVECNKHKDGNLSNYTERLPLRIGQDRFDALLERARSEKQTSHKWDRQELVEIRKYYSQKIADFEDENLTF